jgi:hypothetical protein
LLRLADTNALNARVGVTGLTRELAKARCVQDNRYAEWAERFVDYFVIYAMAPTQTTPEDFNALEVERGNLIAAMEIALSAKNHFSVIRIARVITGFAQFIARGD